MHGNDDEEPEHLKPMHIAALDGRIDELKNLLDNGAEVSIRTNKGMTPLHSAAISNRPDVETNRQRINICPGLYMYYSWTIENAISIDNKGDCEFSNDVRSRLLDAFSAWGQPLFQRVQRRS